MSEASGGREVTGYLRRHVDGVLDQVFAGLPAVMLTGPRACGKTTTAARRASSTIRLDEENQARAFADAPDAVLASFPPPVLVDEWQQVPASLGAIKRAVDSGSGGGRFLVAGSVRARVTGEMWPGTGRVVPLPMYGLTEAELTGAQEPVNFVARLFADGPPAPLTIPEAPDVTEYVDRALRGGFPEAIAMSTLERAYWYPGYIDQLVHRDVAALAQVRSPQRLRLLLEAVAVSTAGMPQLKTLLEAAGLDGRTARAYLDLLVDLRVVDRVPAWHSNRLKRLVKSPKYYITDTGIVGHLLNADVRSILRDGDLLGRLIDNFVAMQILPLVALSNPRVSAYHLRDTNNEREVDLVLEGQGGRIVGMEIKAKAAVSGTDARHLVWLRDQLGAAFHRGVVFHSGQGVHELDDRIWAVPIAAIWSR
jgi:predicted AAA+ superfamily ATPase